MAMDRNQDRRKLAAALECPGAEEWEPPDQLEVSRKVERVVLPGARRPERPAVGKLVSRKEAELVMAETRREMAEAQRLAERQESRALPVEVVGAAPRRRAAAEPVACRAAAGLAAFRSIRRCFRSAAARIPSVALSTPRTATTR